MKKDILKLGMKIVKNTAIKLAERDANTTRDVCYQWNKWIEC